MGTSHSAMFYEPAGDGKARCRLCPHQCLIKDGAAGVCRVRVNRGGELQTKVFGFPDAAHVDPIEKKPLFHFKPASSTLSIATVGCNLRCRFCQNHSISQCGDPGASYGFITPERVVELAVRNRTSVISYTYTEPTVYYEYTLECAKLAHAHGLANVIVSNGYIMPAPLDELSALLDAANIDLKFFKDSLYREYTGGTLQPVLDTIIALHRKGVWVEVTTLVIPGLNDDHEQLAEIAKFIADVSPDIPWHISRFHPTYRLQDRSATPLQRLIDAHEIGKAAGLRYVFTGNVHGSGYEDTVCPDCGELLIKRQGFMVSSVLLEDGCCPQCRFEIAGRFSVQGI